MEIFGNNEKLVERRKKSVKVDEEGQEENKMLEILNVSTPDEYEKQMKFYKARDQIRVEENNVELQTEENSVESQIEENNVELPIEKSLEKVSEDITEEMSNSKNSDENMLKVTHRYPIRSKGPIDYFSLNL
ncbi:hypothetical protein JTB14_019995 [Gonioctena quinquepunctata]|nr:hypothetical protein JTB14_019995 [Gonioctena quinquepunctata]